MLEISISPWVHGTAWLGKEIIRTIHTQKENPYLEQEWVITSFQELKTAAKKGWQGNKLSKLIASFEILQKKLIEKQDLRHDTDPVKYLIYLYFQEELSLKDILQRINGNWFDYKDESGLRRLLKQSLKWRLRDKSEKTVHGKKRISKTTWAIENQKRDASKAEFLSWFIQNGNSENRLKFDIKNLQNHWNKQQKIFYIFEVFYGISQEHFKKLDEKNISHRILAELMEEKIREIPLVDKQSITTISKSDIDRLFLNLQQKNSYI